MQQPLCNLSVELDQLARHAATMQWNTANGLINAYLGWRDVYIATVRPIVGHLADMSTTDVYLTKIAWLAWKTHWCCQFGIGPSHWSLPQFHFSASEFLVQWSGKGTVAFTVVQECVDQYMKDVALPLLTNTRLRQCALVFPHTELDVQRTFAIHSVLQAERARRGAPGATREAFVVSDLSRALRDRGVIFPLQDLIADFAIGSSDLPRIRPRPLSYKAIQTRLNQLAAARGHDDAELNRLCTDTVVYD